MTIKKRKKWLVFNYLHSELSPFHDFCFLLYTDMSPLQSREGKRIIYPFALEMSEALSEKPSPRWTSQDFGADTLQINGFKSGPVTGSAMLPTAGNFI